MVSPHSNRTVAKEPNVMFSTDGTGKMVSTYKLMKLGTYHSAIIKIKLKLIKEWFQDMKFLERHLPNMDKALGLIPIIAKKKEVWKDGYV